MTACRPPRDKCLMAACALLITAGSACAQAPPTLNTVFPAGGQAGQAVEVTIGGSNLDGLQSILCNAPGVRGELVEPTRFRLQIPPDTPPGLYDLWVAGTQGISAPRTFVIGSRPEQLEIEPDDALSEAVPVPMDCVLNGKLDKAGDADYFRFEAKRGQRVILECWAERIDSRLRAVLEVFDAQGRRLEVNRGYFGVDPLIAFSVPADGAYIAKVHDLISAGSVEHYYRLEIDTGPRVAFSIPNVIQRGTAAQVALFGWNLPGGAASGGATPLAFDRVEVEIPQALSHAAWPLGVRLQPAQAVLQGAAFPFNFPKSHAPVVLGLTDVPVVVDVTDNHIPAMAQKITVPCEVSGQLTGGDERDWYVFQAQHGEVLYFEAYGQRIGSPVDLQISLFDAGAEQGTSGTGATVSSLRELARFGDEVRNLSTTLPTSHLDPAGRWVCPADGRYLVSLRNLSGGLQADPRRTYRLSVRREEPDFQVIAVPRDGAGGINIPRGGRVALDLLALRRRGCNGAIRVSAKDLPDGVDCLDVWLGPGVDVTTLVISCNNAGAPVLSELKLEGVAQTEDGSRIVRSAVGGTVVRAGTPSGWGRITSQLPMAVVGDAPMRIVADAHEPLEHHLYGRLPARHSPGGIVDVAVQIERRDTAHQAPVKLIGVGIPDLINNSSSTIPAGEHKGYVSFYLPPALPVGHYSLAIRSETTVPGSSQKAEAVVLYSNAVTLDVQPAAFLVDVDPFAVTRARRGEIIQIGYSAQRRNGFIGKMHTELAAPGCITDVTGLRGRGETFTGQTESGSLQIIINDDAPFGRLSALRLLTVGVVEDEPRFLGSRFLNLEIVE